MGLATTSVAFTAQATDQAARALSQTLNPIRRQKANILVEDTSEVIYVMFNPTEYTESIRVRLNGDSEWQDTYVKMKDITENSYYAKKAFYEARQKMAKRSGRKESSKEKNFGKKPYFCGTEKSQFTVTLFYDTYEAGSDVTEETDVIKELLIPSVSGKSGKHPPICKFRWNNFEYRGIITNLDQKFTMFLSNGQPVRAELTLTFSPIYTAEEEKTLLGREACRRLWTVKSGDRLYLIANKIYKNPMLWPVIAEYNNIENPLTFPEREHLGMELVLPDLAG